LTRPDVAATISIRFCLTVSKGGGDLSESELLERLRAKRALPPAAERKAIRKAAGATLRDVASEIGTSATSVFRWEQGAKPGMHTAAYAQLLEELKRVAA
jgi:DNA-binding transcriptional regulator YiaG